jgi:hypothetical protein
MKLYILGLLGIYSFTNNVIASEYRESGKHLHGFNTMQVVVDGNEMQAIYEMPIVQLYSSDDEHHHDEHKKEHHDEHKKEHHDEHKKEHHDEHKKEHHDEHEKEHHDEHEKEHHDEHETKEAISELKDFNKIFSVNSSAACKLTNFSHEIHSVEKDSSHKDVELTYTLNCKSEDAIKSIQINAFDSFNDLNEVSFEGLFKNQQIKKTINRNNNQILLN